MDGHTLCLLCIRHSDHMLHCFPPFVLCFLIRERFTAWECHTQSEPCMYNDPAQLFRLECVRNLKITNEKTHVRKHACAPRVDRPDVNSLNDDTWSEIMRLMYIISTVTSPSIGTSTQP